MLRNLLFLVAVATLQAGPAWQRHVRTPKGDRVDQPGAHPLAYFTEYPMLRDEDGDFCYLCSPEKRLADAKKQMVGSELKLVGTIQGFEVYDLFYHFECDGCVGWKSILVKTGADGYREIYHLQPTTLDSRADESVLINVDLEVLLGTRYEVGGNKGSYVDDYWWFEGSGPVHIDLDPIRAAAQKALPKGKRLWGGGDSNDASAMAFEEFKFAVWDEGASLCCSPGEVDVRFTLDHGLVVVTSASYHAEGRP